MDLWMADYLDKVSKRVGGPVIFQQDNAPPHTSKKTMKYFQEQKVSILPWPAHSPDLNPIENIWGMIKKERMSQDHFPTTPDQLILEVMDQWERISITTCEHLVDSMPRRLQEVLDNKVYSINY
jgi:transposase